MTELLEYLKNTLTDKKEESRLAEAFECEEAELLELAENIIRENDMPKIILWYKAALSYIPVELICPGYNARDVIKIIKDVLPPLSSGFYKKYDCMSYFHKNTEDIFFDFTIDETLILKNILMGNRKLPLPFDITRQVYFRFLTDRISKEEFYAISYYKWMQGYEAIKYRCVTKNLCY